MGLLIGASCLTLCEVLDLFLYNCFLKFGDRYKRRKSVLVVQADKENIGMDDTKKCHYRVNDAVPMPVVANWMFRLLSNGDILMS